LAQTQAECDSSNACAPLNTRSPITLNGPITYSFDENAMSQFMTRDQMLMPFRVAQLSAAALNRD
jgi:hypothetical protein